ncbi:MAG: helix-turn-helix transcriptional regulator [Hyphomicrobium sp.]|nr:helix-turn-helix transcriptional regulator [Hyphomicrobium sp.]
MAVKDHNLTSADATAIIAKIREALARRRMSRQALADAARISISTLEKVLSGRRSLTLATVVRLEDALGMKLRCFDAGNSEHAHAVGRTVASGHVSPAAAPPVVAPDELGNYARPSVAWLEGAYLTLIPSFGERSAISAYRTDITWDGEHGCLSFRESERVDKAYTQLGWVSMPNQTGHIYLVTNRHGQHRLAILARPTRDGDMHGVLATLFSGRGAQLTPAAVPIVLSPIKKPTPENFGRFSPGTPRFARYRQLLGRTLDEPFAVLLGL